MAHEIEFSADGTPMMAYAGQTPWHGLGTQVAEAMTSAEAITLAHLDGWDVSLGSVHCPDGSEIAGHERVYRKSDNTVFGITRGGWKPIQNEQQFDFMDSLVQDGAIRYEAAMSLLGGKRVVILARLLEDMRILDDQYFPYVVCVGSHEPYKSLQVFPTTVRVICNNTCEMALSADKGKGLLIRHTGDIPTKLQEAARVLRVTTQQQRNYVAWLEQLAQHQTPEREVQSVETALFGSLDEETGGRRKAAIERFRDIYAQEETRNGANGYTVFQTITGYGNFGRTIRTKGKGDDARFLSIFDGSAGEFMERGASVLSTVTGVTLAATR